MGWEAAPVRPRRPAAAARRGWASGGVGGGLGGGVQKWAEGKRSMARVNRQERAASVETLPDETEYFVGAGDSRSRSAANSDVLHDDDLDRSRSSSVSSIDNSLTLARARLTRREHETAERVST